MMDFPKIGSVLGATNWLNNFFYLCIPLLDDNNKTDDNDKIHKHDSKTLYRHMENAYFWANASYEQFR